MKMKAAYIRAALKRSFGAPEWAVVFEVAQSTGHNANRHLDAVAMDLWPSHGFALHGIEVKVSKADLRRELALPEKAEELSRLCDYFHIAAPAGMVDVKELPMAWGLLEVHEDGSITTKQKPERTESEKIGRPFLAALMRASTRPIDPETFEATLAAEREQMERHFEMRVESAAKRQAGRSSEAARNWEALVEALGEDPGKDIFYSSTETIDAIKAVRASGATKSYSGLRFLHNTLTKATEGIEAGLAELGIEVEKQKRRKRKAA